MSVTPQQRLLAEQLLKASRGDYSHATLALRSALTKAKEVPKKPHSDQLIVEVHDVAKNYKVGRQRVAALQGVNLDIYESEFVAITGTSGSGKSTLLHLIGGLDRPTTGTISVAGRNIAKLRDGKLSAFRNKTIGFVFQFFYLQPFLSLQTNIEVPAMFARAKRWNRRARSLELAKIVKLDDRLKHLPRELSGGQMQRAAIARALQNQPRILLADEPTGNLDRANALAIFDLFRQISTDHGTTVIVVTHDLELASMADRSINMSDGAIV